EQCAKVIKPALERIAEYLRTKGMDARVSEAQERRGRDGRLEQREEIAIRLLIKSDEHPYPGIHEQPCFSLHPDKHKQLIDLWQSTMRPRGGGQSGGVGTVTLDQVTEELLEGKVL